MERVRYESHLIIWETMRRLKRKFPLARACCRGENDDDDDDDNDDKQRKWIGESGMRNRETWSSASLIDPELSTSTAWKKTRRSSVVLLLESCAIISSHTLCSALLSPLLVDEWKICMYCCYVDRLETAHGKVKVRIINNKL